MNNNIILIILLVGLIFSMGILLFAINIPNIFYPMKVTITQIPAEVLRVGI